MSDDESEAADEFFDDAEREMAEAEAALDAAAEWADRTGEAFAREIEEQEARRKERNRKGDDADPDEQEPPDEQPAEPECIATCTIPCTQSALTATGAIFGFEGMGPPWVVSVTITVTIPAMVAATPTASVSGVSKREAGTRCDGFVETSPWLAFPAPSFLGGPPGTLTTFIASATVSGDLQGFVVAVRVDPPVATPMVGITASMEGNVDVETTRGQACSVSRRTRRRFSRARS